MLDEDAAASIEIEVFKIIVAVNDITDARGSSTVPELALSTWHGFILARARE